MNQGKNAASQYTQDCNEYQSNIEAHKLKYSLWIGVCSARQGACAVFSTIKELQVLLEDVVDNLFSVFVI